MPRDVRILLVGDDDCGKSTLITSLIKEAFIERVQHVVPEISLPPEVSPEGCVTRIVDTSAAPEHRAHLEAELRRASVICLVYSISAPSSFDRIPTYWLPLFRSLGVQLPVILVGNKIDLRSGQVTNAALEHELAPVMAEFEEVESCVECSARLPLNVSEVFYFAQRAVLYPTAPLYDARGRCLRADCVEALKRIFRLCDADKDGVLNDVELNDFQRKCFESSLQPHELDGIKDLVLSAPLHGGGGGGFGGGGLGGAAAAVGGYHHWEGVSTSEGGASSSAGIPDSSSGQQPAGLGGGGSVGGASSLHSRRTAAAKVTHPHLRDGCLTLSGFLYLHTLFIQRGRLETTWTVLRTFGYGATLQLDESFVRPHFVVPPECSVELSPHGYQFLTDIFEAHDKDRDGALSPPELDSLFATVPSQASRRHPWSDDAHFPHESTVTDEHGNITLQGWLAQWSMTTLLDHRTTLEYLAYLGYPSFVAPPVAGGDAAAAGSSSSSSAGATRGWTGSSSKAGGGGGGGFFSSKPKPAAPTAPRSNGGLSAGSHDARNGGSAPTSGSRSTPISPAPTTTALQLTRPRRADRKSKGRLQRGTLLAYVVGSPGCGKTALLRSMLGRPFSDEYAPTGASAVAGANAASSTSPTAAAAAMGKASSSGGGGGGGGGDGTLSVVCAVEHAGAEKYLVLQEVTTRAEPNLLRSPPRVEAADVVVFAHDASDTHSFSYVAWLRRRYALLASKPSVFVATKSDVEAAQQRHEVQPDVYCRRLGLRIPMLAHVGAAAAAAAASVAEAGSAGGGVAGSASGSGPLAVSARTGEMVSELWSVVCAVALDPRGAVPGHHSGAAGAGAGGGGAGGSASAALGRMAAWLLPSVFGGGAGVGGEGEHDDDDDDDDDDDADKGGRNGRTSSSARSSTRRGARKTVGAAETGRPKGSLDAGGEKEEDDDGEDDDDEDDDEEDDEDEDEDEEDDEEGGEEDGASQPRRGEAPQSTTATGAPGRSGRPRRRRGRRGADGAARLGTTVAVASTGKGSLTSRRRRRQEQERRRRQQRQWWSLVAWNAWVALGVLGGGLVVAAAIRRAATSSSSAGAWPLPWSGPSSSSSSSSSTSSEGGGVAAVLSAIWGAAVGGAGGGAGGDGEGGARGRSGSGGPGPAAAGASRSGGEGDDGGGGGASSWLGWLRATTVGVAAAAAGDDGQEGPRVEL